MAVSGGRSGGLLSLVRHMDDSAAQAGQERGRYDVGGDVVPDLHPRRHGHVPEPPLEWRLSRQLHKNS